MSRDEMNMTKCDVKTCAKEATYTILKSKNPKLISDVHFCDQHAQAVRLIGAELGGKPKDIIQSEMDKLVELNKEPHSYGGGE